LNSKIVNIMGLVGGIVVFVVLASSLAKNLSRVRVGEAVVEKTRAKIEKAESENQKLSIEAEVTQRDAFIEKQFRDKMGLVREGEITVVLPEANIVKRLSPQILEEEEVKPKPNWQKWLDLFL